MENSRVRPLHHQHILQAMIDDGQLPPGKMPDNYIAGNYSIDPYHYVDDSPYVTGKVV